MTKPKDDSEDLDLFRRMVGTVKPVEDGRIEKSAPRPSAHPKQAIQDEQEVLRESLSDHYDPESIQPGDTLSFCRDGIQKALFRKLRTGQFRTDAELDLHGSTAAEARSQLLEFLRYCQREGDRVARIIHGKGFRSSNQGPVLKPLVNTWLRQCDEVLAFHSAMPRDGGTGAIYVLIKSRSG
jgi:DNA-nicking Smr family endonuclease